MALTAAELVFNDHGNRETGDVALPDGALPFDALAGVSSGARAALGFPAIDSSAGETSGKLEVDTAALPRRLSDSLISLSKLTRMR